MVLVEQVETEGDVGVLRGVRGTTGWLRRRTLAMFVFVGAVLTLWALATPIWTPPDEAPHTFRAYGVARGDVIAQEPSTDVPYDTYGADFVPKGLADSAATIGCYAFQPQVPASCLLPIDEDATRLVEYANPAGRYVPTYYALVGWPSLLVGPDLVVAAQRTAAIGLGALMIAWALSAALALRTWPLAVLGVGISCSPMVLYLGGVVNPNSLEITAALAAGWCLLVAMLDPASPLATMLFRRAMVAAALLAVLRMLSPLWLACIALVFLVVFRGELLRTLLLRRHLPWTALPVLGALANVAWTFTSAGSVGDLAPVADVTPVEAVRQSMLRIDGGLNEVIAAFGWLDTRLSYGEYTYFLAAALFVLGACSLLLRARELLGAFLLVALAYLVPVAVQAWQWEAVGPIWQARYTLPLLVLIPTLFTGFAAARHEVDAWLPRLAWSIVPVMGLVAYVHIRSYYVQLRRNVGGVNGSAFEGSWTPPIGAELQLALMAACVLVAWIVPSMALIRSARSGVSPATDPDQPPVRAPAAGLESSSAPAPAAGPGSR